MAWITTIIAADGAPLTPCHHGKGIPSNTDTLEYTNPRTKKTERARGIMAWAGAPDDPCPPKTVHVTIV